MDEDVILEVLLWGAAIVTEAAIIAWISKKIYTPAAKDEAAEARKEIRKAIVESKMPVNEKNYVLDLLDEV